MSGGVVWFTGLSGSGKTTLAEALAQRIRGQGGRPYVLDGDALRRGLSRDLGFSDADRREQVRRAAEVSAMLAQAGVLCLVAVIAPFQDARRAARAAVRPHPFLEVHVCTSVEVCRSRDPKGLYRRCDQGRLVGLTGVDAPYEPPTDPDLRLDAGNVDPQACVTALMALLGDSAMASASALGKSRPGPSSA